MNGRKMMNSRMSLLLIAVCLCAGPAWAIDREAPKFTPTIDGTITAAEMSGQLAIPMSWPFPGGFEAFNEAGDGINDLSATWYVSWDETSLNVSAVVLDNTPDYRSASRGPYNGQDTIQPCFNPNNDPAHQFSPDPGGGPAAIYDMAVDTSDAFGSDVYRHGALFKPGQQDSISIVGTKDGNGTDAEGAGYVLEMALPWSIAMDDVDSDYVPQVNDIHGLSFILVSFNGQQGGAAETATLFTDFGNGVNTIGDPTSWNSITLTAGSLLGDVNLDGLVNGLDVDPFVEVLLSGPNQAEADMNGDGEVNGLDVDPFVAAVVGGTQSVPEPSTLLLTLVALGMVGGWRKWKRAA
jgi:hypothetical protein